MSHVALNEKIEEVKRPDGITAVQVCSHSGLRCTGDCHAVKKNSISGKEVYESTCVIEYFEKGTEPDGYCDVHGDGVGYLANVELNSAATARELLYVLPIKPKQESLVGADPYGTNIPDFQPFSVQSRVDNSAVYGAILDDIGNLDDEALILMAKPGRLHIDE